MYVRRALIRWFACRQRPSPPRCTLLDISICTGPHGQTHIIHIQARAVTVGEAETDSGPYLWMRNRPDM